MEAKDVEGEGRKEGWMDAEGMRKEKTKPLAL